LLKQQKQPINQINKQASEQTKVKSKKKNLTFFFFSRALCHEEFSVRDISLGEKFLFRQGNFSDHGNQTMMWEYEIGGDPHQASLLQHTFLSFYLNYFTEILA
jgi:hypothetical protein